MKLLPIDVDETQNERFAREPECIAILAVYPDFYKKVGFHKPWIGYFVADDANQLIGCGGFKGKPQNNCIEIAYGTFKSYQGRGIGTAICRELVLLSGQTDPTVKITARTLPENYPSIKILQKNGFVCLGTVLDDEDGEVLEWEYKLAGEIKYKGPLPTLNPM